MSLVAPICRLFFVRSDWSALESARPTLRSVLASRHWPMLAHDTVPSDEQQRTAVQAVARAFRVAVLDASVVSSSLASRTRTPDGSLPLNAICEVVEQHAPTLVALLVTPSPAQFGADCQVRTLESMIDCILNLKVFR